MVLLGRIELASHAPNVLKNNDIFSVPVPVVIAGCNRFGKVALAKVGLVRTGSKAGHSGLLLGPLILGLPE